MRNKEEYEKIANKIGSNLSAIDIVNSISGSRHDSKDVLQLILRLEIIMLMPMIMSTEWYA